MTGTRATPTTTTSEPEAITADVRYLFTLTGDCRLILNNTAFFQRFLQGFNDLLVKQLKLSEKYKPGEISCGSVHVYVTFEHVIWPDFDIKIQSAILNGGPGLEIPVWMDNYFVTFVLSHAKHVPLDPSDARTYSIVTEVMDDVDIVVIIVACCVCSVLIAIGVVICVKECYRRKHAQSFNLLEVPHVNVKLEDFTLTRIPRPRAIYTDPGSAPAVVKGFSERDGDGSATMVHNLRSGAGLSQHGVVNGGGGRAGGIHPSEMHLRIQQHSDGIIVGVTSSSSSYYPPSNRGVDHSYSYQDEALSVDASSGHQASRKPRLRAPVGDAAEGNGASERLLDHSPRCLGDQLPGTMNPVYVDDQEEVREARAGGMERECPEEHH